MVRQLLKADLELGIGERFQLLSGPADVRCNQSGDFPGADDEWKALPSRTRSLSPTALRLNSNGFSPRRKKFPIRYNRGKVTSPASRSWPGVFPSRFSSLSRSLQSSRIWNATPIVIPELPKRLTCRGLAGGRNRSGGATGTEQSCRLLLNHRQAVLLGETEIAPPGHLHEFPLAHGTQRRAQNREKTRVGTVGHQLERFAAEVVAHGRGDPPAPFRGDAGAVMANRGGVNQVIMDQRGHVDEFHRRRHVQRSTPQIG